jgi:hypothetical protein
VKYGGGGIACSDVTKWSVGQISKQSVEEIAELGFNKPRVVKVSDDR